jgi:hypothetical protein
VQGPCGQKMPSLAPRHRYPRVSLSQLRPVSSFWTSRDIDSPVSRDPPSEAAARTTTVLFHSSEVTLVERGPLSALEVKVPWRRIDCRII